MNRTQQPDPMDKPKRFFDDWELTIGDASGGGAFLKLDMPHNPTQQMTYITGSRLEIRKVANTLDQLLSHLTNTTITKVIIDGPNEPPRRS